MPIRHYQPGDEAAQAAIFNEAAAGLPGFKPAQPDDLRRRFLARDFDPTSRFYLEDNGQVVGYTGLSPGGRVSFPWCRRGYEGRADELFAAALDGLRARGVTTALAAYHAGWTAQAEFFLRHGFQRAREMLNFVQDILELPTLSARRSTSFSEFRPEDVPDLMVMAPALCRGQPAAAIAKALLRNPYFPPESLFVLRYRSGGKAAAVGLLVENPAYADPHAVDSSQPCFRLGALGTEGLTHKRVNGMFSFVCAPDAQVSALGLDLLGHAASRLDGTTAYALAAQAPSDVPHLARFYQTHFRLQGRFPVFERAL